MAAELRLTFHEYVVEGRAGYRFITKETTWLEVYGGIRFWDVQQNLSLTGPLGIVINSQATAGDTWIDPIIGLRGRYEFANGWGVVGQGDFGVFGVGSDLSWRLQGGIQRSFQNGLSLDLQYKALQADFDNGNTDASRFVWIVLQHGPLARISYRF
ncbi:MAG: hypothetical protein ABJQ71_15285 [Roseibium sp.]